MKCPICNAENASEARSCERCGFSLSLAQQVTWPELPRVEFPKPVEMPEWPQPPGGESVPVSSMFTRPAAPAEPEILPVAGEAPREVAVVEPPVGEVSLQEQPSDDELAREHVARGFKALGEGMLDQARWEFEQARDLADSSDIVRMAQVQLDDLLKSVVPQVQERLRPIRKPASAPIPTPTPALPQIDAEDLKVVFRTGLILALVVGAMIACSGSAAICLGFLLAPAAGFAAGWLTTRQASQPGRKANVVSALLAAALAGLGVWIGEVIGYSTRSPSSTTGTDSAAWQSLSCLSGFFYLALSAGLGAVGWRTYKPTN